MRALFLVLAGILALSAAADPAPAQYYFLDTNGDGTNRCADPGAPADRLTPGVTAVDVYIVTNRTLDGSEVVCSMSEGYVPPLSLYSFEFILRASGPGTIQYQSWVDAAGFPSGLIPLGDFTMASKGSDVWVGRFTMNALGAGKYRLGTLSVKVTGYPNLDFAITTPMANQGAAETYFGSHCLGVRVDNVHRLGEDFHDACGTVATDPGDLAVWDRIQSLYR